MQELLKKPSLDSRSRKGSKTRKNFETFVEFCILHSAVNAQHCCKQTVGKVLSPLILVQTP